MKIKTGIFLGAILSLAVAAENPVIAASLIDVISATPENTGDKTDHSVNSAGSNTSGTPLPFASLPDYGQHKWTCNPGFPHGLRGTLKVNLQFVFKYNPHGDMIIEAQKGLQELKDDISSLASAHPGGPQIVFVNRNPIDLNVVFYLSGRSNTGNGDFTAYWGNMDTASFYQSGMMFTFGTKAHEPTEDEGDFGSWVNYVLLEAAKEWYNHIANGWTCK